MVYVPLRAYVYGTLYMRRSSLNIGDGPLKQIIDKTLILICTRTQIDLARILSYPHMLLYP